jgi:hypothetical protein
VTKSLHGSQPRFRAIIYAQRLIPELAREAYENRELPEGRLDNGRLAVLADALEESGLTDERILSHLRSAGPHVRGCHALDAILGQD